MQNYTNIIEIIISLLSAVITAFIIPILKQRLSAEKQEKLMFWVQTAVKAAEQIYGTKTGQEKKEYVVRFLLSKGIVIDVDEVSALIESEVYKLKEATEKAAV
ncbi:MAG: phage holin, LLH family [Acutalibacteraceae bacterium]